MFAPASQNDARNFLQKAKGALICPQLFKAGFFVGGEGGQCVLVGRSANGWSAPAFYDIGSGSFGLQIGVQDSEVVFIVLTDKGFQALLNSQFQIGADASVAVAAYGAGVAGATTAAFKADIVSFARTRGLYGGISFEGSLISSQTGWNQAYYGRPLAAQQIVLQNEASNPGAAPLSETLARYTGR
jgi:lipid-binding SYLF domain-containing protein